MTEITIDDFEAGRRGHKPRNSDRLEKAGKSKETSFPLELPERNMAFLTQWF